MEEQVKSLTIKLWELVWEYGPDVLLAIFTLVLGLWFVKVLTRRLRKTLAKKNLDPSLTPFLLTLLSISLKVFLVVSVISMVGVKVTSFVAIIGAAGLAIGLALQGTLQNFAGGVIILILKPFTAGDVIEAKGYIGTVREIQIFYTIIHTADKKVVYIPNGSLANSDMTNYSREQVRRNEWIFGIAYGDDVDKARQVLAKLIAEDERILEDPEPLIALHSLGDSSVNLVVRAWSVASDLWPVHFDMNESVYKTFTREGLNIPFPQLDVYVKNPK